MALQSEKVECWMKRELEPARIAPPRRAVELTNKTLETVNMDLLEEMHAPDENALPSKMLSYTNSLELKFVVRTPGESG